MLQIGRKMVLSCLKELSDLDFQKRVWIRGEGPEVASLTEVICELYDDSGLGEAFEKGICVYTSEIDAKLQLLIKLLDSIEKDRAISDIVESSEWTSIVRVSRELHEMILKL